MGLKCMVVDDEEMSRSVVKKFIAKTPTLELTQELSSGVEAYTQLTQNDNPDVDIIFLDVQMPGMSGMELMEKLEGVYHIIFTTSEEKYAAKAFEGSAVDFLVKPFDYERFIRAIEKAKEAVERQRMKAESFKDFFVKSGSKFLKINIDEIKYIEALADYILIFTKAEKHIVHHTLKGIEAKLPQSHFTRVHRSYIINNQSIDSIEDMHVFIGEKGIPVGGSFRDRLYSKLNFL